jgi:phage gpG-like protein
MTDVMLNKFPDLKKLFSSKLPYAKIGIFGDKVSRNGEENNAEVGAIHEFGIGVPERSFLRVPLITNYNRMIKSLDIDSKRPMTNSYMVDLVTKLGLIGKGVVQDAFMTEGYGKWESSQRVLAEGGNTLVDTQQLRESIDSEVV